MVRPDEHLNRRRFVAATGAIALLAGCTGGGETGSNGATTTGASAKTTKQAASGGTTTQRTAETGTETTDQATTTTGGPAAETVPVGKMVDGDALSMVVRKVRTADSLGEFTKAKSGNTYEVVRLAVKNTSDGFVNFSSFLSVRLKDAANHVYDPALGSTDHPIRSGLLAPGEVARGDVAFEVPTDASTLAMQFDFSSFDLFSFDRVTVELGKQAGSIADLKQELGVPVHQPGSTVSHGDVAVTVHGVRTKAKLDQFNEAPDGHVFVIPDFSVKNAGSDPLTVSSLLQMQVKTGAGFTVGSSVSSAVLDHSYSEGSDIAPGETRRGELAYAVEKGAEPLYWAFNFMSLSDPEKAFWKLR